MVPRATLSVTGYLDINFPILPTAFLLYLPFRIVLPLFLAFFYKNATPKIAFIYPFITYLLAFLASSLILIYNPHNISSPEGFFNLNFLTTIIVNDILIVSLKAASLGVIGVSVTKSYSKKINWILLIIGCGVWLSVNLNYFVRWVSPIILFSSAN